MSMYRQLWLSILASMLIALGASLFATLMSARTYLEAQLAMKNQDNATTLALALSQGNHDRTQVTLAVTALFNSGHYRLIRVTGADGSLLVDKVDTQPLTTVPAWFVALQPIHAQPGQAEISNGWQRLGTLTLVSHDQFAYRSLWQATLGMGAVFCLAALLGGFLASLVLRRITRPMRAVVAQAKAINERRFISIAMPDVPELNELARAMNDAVSQLRQDFEADAQRYEALRQEANLDPLTHLANRTFFMASLDSALTDDNTPYTALAIVRLRNLGKINRGQGREVADELLRKVGRVISDLAAHHTGSLGGRLNGGDFAFLLAGSHDPASVFERLLHSLPNIAEPIISAGGSEYSTTYIAYSLLGTADTRASLLARLDASLTLADANATSAVQEAASSLEARLSGGAEQWRSTLHQALAQADAIRLEFFPLRVGAGAQTHQEAPLRLRTGANQPWLSASNFLPLADRLGMTHELDMAALKLALAELDRNAALDGLWLNLSAKSIADPEFRRVMLHLIADHPASHGRLYLEIPEAGGLAHLGALRDLSRTLKPLRCRLGLEHYGHHFSKVSRLYDLDLDFLKVDASFIQDIHNNPGNQAFLKGLCDIAHRIGMQVFAEGVEQEEALPVLTSLGFDGASGAAVK